MDVTGFWNIVRGEGEAIFSPRFPGRPGFTFVEVMIALGLFLFLLALGLRAWQTFRGRTAENLSKHLLLQMEARRALLQLYKEVQEGVEVVSPLPGSTLPYMAYKDGLNNLRMIYLDKDPDKTRDEGKPIYRLMSVRREISTSAAEPPRCMMEHVSRLTFTTYHPGGVVISATLRGGKGEFSFVNFIRLQNFLCEDNP